MGEKHLPARFVFRPPIPHSSLESPQMLILHPAPAGQSSVHQMLEKRLRLRFRSLPHHLLRLRPDLLQQIFAGLSGVRHPPLFEDVFLAQTLARCLAGHLVFNAHMLFLPPWLRSSKSFVSWVLVARTQSSVHHPGRRQTVLAVRPEIPPF